MLAGTAKVDITPANDVWMDGMIRSHRSVGVHDRLYARALYLTPDHYPAHAFVVLSVDLCGLEPNDSLAVRTAAATEVGAPVDHIIIAATHTHSSPAAVGYLNSAEPGYVQDLLPKLVRAIKQAAEGARPAAAGCGSGREDTISHYRRLLADDGHVVMNWEPYPPERIVGPLGQADTEVSVLKIVDAADYSETMCILFNHAGHPCIMSGDNYLISADYPGVAASVLERDFGGVAMFLNGAQGSVDIDGLRDRDWQGVERAGRALATAVVDAAHAIVPTKAPAILGAHGEYRIPRRKITESEWVWAQQILEKTGGAVQPMVDGVGDDYLALHYRKLRQVQDSDIAVTQTCFAVGDTAFISFPGELYTEIGMRIKAESPFSRTCILGLANGQVGYVPTREAISQGGYDVDVRELDADPDLIVKSSLDLLREVHEMCAVVS